MQFIRNTQQQQQQCRKKTKLTQFLRRLNKKENDANHCHVSEGCRPLLLFSLLSLFLYEQSRVVHAADVALLLEGGAGAVRGQAKVTSDPSPRPPELSDSCNFVFSLSPAGRVCSSVSSYISGVAESSGH